MICRRCGKSLPSEGIVCPFCGNALNQDELNKRRIFQGKRTEARLLSDKYGVDKSSLYKKEEQNENKLLGLAIILGVLLFLIILVILVNAV